MQTRHHTLSLTRTLAALGAALACGPLLAAQAGAAAHAEAKARYDREVAACRSGQNTQDLSACLDEARSAYAEARRGVLGDGLEVDSAAAMKRCEALEGDERSACVARMNGQGTTSGSVAAGGIYRELVTREKAPAAMASGNRPNAASGTSSTTSSMPAPARREAPGVPQAAPKAANEGAVKPTPQ